VPTEARQKKCWKAAESQEWDQTPKAGANGETSQPLKYVYRTVEMMGLPAEGELGGGRLALAAKILTTSFL